MSLPMEGDWTGWPWKVPSHPNQAVILVLGGLTDWLFCTLLLTAVAVVKEKLAASSSQYWKGEDGEADHSVVEPSRGLLLCKA